MDIEKIAKQKAEHKLKTEGIKVNCPFCKESFIARNLYIVCPHCSKTLDVEFNVK